MRHSWGLGIAVQQTGFEVQGHVLERGPDNKMSLAKRWNFSLTRFSDSLLLREVYAMLLPQDIQDSVLLAVRFLVRPMKQRGHQRQKLLEQFPREFA